MTSNLHHVAIIFLVGVDDDFHICLLLGLKQLQRVLCQEVVLERRCLTESSSEVQLFVKMPFLVRPAFIDACLTTSALPRQDRPLYVRWYIEKAEVYQREGERLLLDERTQPFQ